MNDTVKCNSYLEVRLNDAFHDQLIGCLRNLSLAWPRIINKRIHSFVFLLNKVKDVGCLLNIIGQTTDPTLNHAHFLIPKHPPSLRSFVSGHFTLLPKLAVLLTCQTFLPYPQGL
jgi:hypothetical protein